MVQEILFKDISQPQRWCPFCSVEQDDLCNFVEGVMNNMCCVIIFNLDQWFRRCLKVFVLSYKILFTALVAFCWIKQKHLCNFSRRH